MNRFERKTMKPLQTISNLNDFMTEPVSFLQEVASEGPIKVSYLGPKRFIFIFDADLAHEVLVKKAPIYIQNRTVFDRIKPVTGKRGLVQLEGKDSQMARATSRPMFSTNSLESARAIVEKYCDEMLVETAASSNFDVTEKMTYLILRTTLAILLGMETTELVDQMGKKFLRLNYLCGLRMRSLAPAPLFIPTSRNREIKQLQSEIRNLIKHQLVLVKVRGVAEAFRGDDALVDHCMTFLFAGHETTAASIAFALLLLAKNPSYQDTVARGNNEAVEAIYKESLRLFPPAYMLAREAKKDDIIGGVNIRKSDQVIIGISSLHKNPLYFDEPEKFYPERFLQKLKHPFCFIPFGAGGKSCVGERLAYMEAVIILKKICQRYHLSAVSESILYDPLITLHPLPEQLIQLRERKS
ncbi:MAG: cytochrome P450 [Bdellovibrionaceae bacterium]|nr:cytochrome P450 [Pseudobdellovibrionaceae bacterium]